MKKKKFTHWRTHVFFFGKWCICIFFLSAHDLTRQHVARKWRFVVVVVVAEYIYIYSLIVTVSVTVVTMVVMMVVVVRLEVAVGSSSSSMSETGYVGKSFVALAGRTTH
jgi:hypothetical protein